MENWNASSSSHEEVFQEPPIAVRAYPAPRRLRRERPRWVVLVFYLFLVFLNVSILFMFGGGTAGDVVRFFDRVVPLEQGGPAMGHAAYDHEQFPPGENWDAGTPPGVQPTPAPR